MISKFNSFDRIFGKYIAAVMLSLSIIWAAYIHLTSSALPFDDAFISFRYVDNFLQGRGLVYNDGQRVFGSTTPLYVLLLIAVRNIAGFCDLPQLAVRFNLIPFLCSGILAYILILNYTGCFVLAAIGGAALLVDPTLLAISIGGMETFVFTSLILYALLLMSNNPNPAFLGVVIGFAILARPEGFLLILIVCLLYLRLPEKILIVIGAAALTIAPWFIFAIMYYGSPIPVSVIAKLKRLYPLPQGESINKIMQNIAYWLFANHFASLKQILPAAATALVVCTSIACLVSRTFRKRKAWLPASFLWGMLLCYLIGNPLIFAWYMPPIFICALITITIGLPAIGFLIHQLLNPEKPYLSQLVLFVPVFLTIAFSGIMTLERYRATGAGSHAVNALTETPSRLRIINYRHAAELINQINSKASVAAPEIGAFGYYFKGRILDACGLISPEIHQFLPVPDDQRTGYHIGAISNEMVQFWQPDFVVSIPVFISMSLLKSSWFSQHYILLNAAQLPKNYFLSNEVMIFKRKQ